VSAGTLNISFSVEQHPYEVVFLEQDGVRVVANPADIEKYSHLHRAAMLGMERPAVAPVWFVKEQRHRDVEMITARVPGQQDFSRRPVTEADRRDFAEEYLAWKTTGRVFGTPLTSLTEAESKEVELNSHLLADLAAGGCVTLEQLAGLQDGVVRTVMGGVALRKRAQAVLDRRRAQIIPPPIQAALAALEARITQLESNHAARQS
jgi:hypothetical protein